MADSAHKATDAQLAKIEKKLAEIYGQAAKDVEKKTKDYFEKFKEQENKMIFDPTVDADQYMEWYKNKVLYGQHWENLKENVTQKLLESDKTAVEYVNGQVPSVYIKNYNSVANGLENNLKGYSFELVDEATVKNLAMSEKTLLPYKVLDGQKAERWDTKLVNAQVTQGIVQGESIDEIAKRLYDNVFMTAKGSAIRNARTTITSAENKGRTDMLKQAEKQGVVAYKVWMAISDQRTRDAHAELDGQEQPVDEPFQSSLGEIMYPGDPDADPANVYNCRCTLGYKVVSVNGNPVDADVVEAGEEKEAEPVVVFDKTPYENTSMTAMFYQVKDENKELGKEFWNTLQDMGKPSDVWKKYLNGELSPEASAKIDSILAQYNGTGSPKKPVSEKKLAAEKELNDAKEAQAAAQDALDAYGNQTFSGIWKDDVTLDDYEYKKGSIQAKMDYFTQKQASDPNNPKWNEMIQQLEEFQTKGEEYSELKADLKEAKQKVWDLTGQSTATDGGFSNGYPQDRKDAALWAKSPKEADDKLRDKTGEVWRNATQTERSAIYEYTVSFHKFNEPLRGIEYGTNANKGVGNTNLNANGNGKYLNAMTDIIDKCSYDFDIWMQRGAGYRGMDSFFGVSESLLRSGSQSDLENALMNKAVPDYGFFSCGDSKGAGFSSNPIIMNVFAPSGTKMMYAEPFSGFGNGGGKAWDGVSKQRSFGSEAEVIMQQGTIFKITKIDRAYPGATIYLDVEVVGQGEPQRWKK